MDCPIPLLETGRHGQPDPEGGDRGHRETSFTNLQRDFLGILDSRHPMGGSQPEISFPEERRHVRYTHRIPSGWDGGGDKSQPSTGGDYARQGPGHLSCSDLQQAQNAGPTKSAPL